MTGDAARTDPIAAPPAAPNAAPNGDLHALEAAAFRAWPALETEDLHGWHLRFARGYTRRANSANATPATPSADDEAAAAQVRDIEARFAGRGLPPVFRLVSFDAAPTFDDTLAGRGYRFLDLSLVMVAPLDGAARPDDDAPPPQVLDDAGAWLGHYRAITGSAGADQETHLRMLRAIPARTAFATATLPGAGTDGPAAACALGVLDGESLGLFDIATHPDARRQGHAGRLCAGLMRWARGQGARRAYLQVLASNHGAIALYERLGFRRAYHYWYRVAG